MQAIACERIFDGRAFRSGVVLMAGGRIAGLVGRDALPPGTPVRELGEGLLAPGFVDLQVNGGGGVMLNDEPSLETLERMARAHAGLGATTILPTLVTDRPGVAARAVEAVAAAQGRGLPGIEGLHLEGPHLDPARKGAHDAALIRPMTEGDLAALTAARARLGTLVVTVAPEAATAQQVAALAAAGIVVALGHSGCSYATARLHADAGARVVTHLFNAMSQLSAREPGLAGAALDDGRLSAGLIADGIHVHPATIRAALAAKRGPGRIFLVSDAMATAGSDIASFALNGRRITRAGGRLTLADGTLAGADLDLARALRLLVGQCGVPLARALAMATSVPAAVAGLGRVAGRLAAGRAADLVHLSPGLHLRSVWQGGAEIPVFAPGGEAGSPGLEIR
ncbi:MAG: N-acetylglucosamine-6-phosphate deacetylase [Rhodobacteraceae bacterium]|nr:N-acetylglucosamine-6-phosphate deacetylase [Paracoccaceae bacterium]